MNTREYRYYLSQQNCTYNLVRKCQEESPLERYWHRSEDNIKINLRAVDCCEAWNGVNWLWIGYLVMNLGFHENRLFLHYLSNYELLKRDPVPCQSARETRI
jgi:hypothetical protein